MAQPQPAPAVDVEKACRMYQKYLEQNKKRSEWFKTEEGMEYNRAKGRRWYHNNREKALAQVKARQARRREASPPPAGFLAPAEPPAEPPAQPEPEPERPEPPAPEPTPARPPAPEPAPPEPPAPEPAPVLRSVTPGRTVSFMDRPVNLYMGRSSTPARAQTPVKQFPQVWGMRA
jgi:hypothetical protein